MGWIRPTDGATPFESLLGHRPELVSRYRTFYQGFWRDGRVPRRVLELTRLRIAAIHDCEAEWLVRDAAVALPEADVEALRRGEFSRFAPAEQSALAVAEQIPYAHHQITDAEVHALERDLGAAGAVALLTALAFFDVACRLKLVLGVEAQACTLDDPPLRQGSLL